MTQPVMQRIKEETDHGVTRYRTDALVSPMDSVRWASILAGLFTVFASLIFFTILGVAVGFTTLDANNPQSFVMGASVYSILAAVVSFALGGFIAARTAAVAGRGNALLNGGMVWIVTIALIVNFLGTGVGTILGIAGNVAGTAVEAAAPIAAEAAAQAADELQENPEAAATVAAEATEVVGSLQETVENVQEELENVTPAEVEEASRTAAQAAWWALLALGVSAAAALGGGILGTRTEPTEIATN